MKNRISIFMLALALFLSIFINEAQTSGAGKKRFKVYMILWRGITDAERGFMDYLKQQKVSVDFILRDSQKDKDRIVKYISEIRTLKPDLIYAFGTTITSIIAGDLKKSQTEPEKYITDIPIVFNIVADPVGAKLVPNLISSERNLTGASHLVPVKACVKAMMSVDHFKKVGIIFNRAEQNSVLRVEQLEEEAKSGKFTVVKGLIMLDKKGQPREDSIASTVKFLADKKVDIIYIPSESFLISNSRVLMDSINKYGIPSFSETEEPIKISGALMGLVSKYYNMGKFVGYKARQIMVNKKHPRDIPIETLKRFSFLIDIDTAKKLGFYPPLQVLKFAEVIQRKN